MKKEEIKRQDAKFAPVAKTKIALMLGRTIMKTLKVVVNFGGGSHTNGQELVIGTPEFVLEGTDAYKEASKLTGLKFDYMEVWMMRTSLLVHETAHLLFSSFREFKRFQDWAIVEFDSLKSKLTPNGQKVLPQVIRRVAAQLNNAIEDGRVEHFVVNKFPGSAKYLKFFNGLYWKKSVKKQNSNVVNLIMSLCYIATSGVAPQYFKKLDKELQNNINNVWNDVLDVTNTASPSVATKKMQRIMIKLKPYLEKILIEEIENAALLQEILQMLAEMADFQNANPMDKPDKDLDGSSISIHIKVKGAGKGKGGKGEKSEEKSKDGSGGGEESKDESKDESEDGSGSGKDGKDGKDEKDGEDGKGGKDGKDEKDEKDGEGEGKGRDYSKDKPSAKRQAPDHAERGGDETGKDKSTDNAENNGQGTGGKNEAPDSSNEDIDQINEAIKQEIDEAIKESTESASKEYDTQIKKAEKEASTDEGLTDSDVDAIRGGYGDPHVEGYKSVNVNVNQSAPEEIKKRGRMLRKQLEAFFKEQETYDLRGQHAGRLDKKSLHKIGVNDYRIFEKKGQPYHIDTCLSIVWDGSGSMNGGKQKQSTMACATIEEALKPLMPLRIFNFTTDCNVVKHFNVKGFNDKDANRNYAYSYGTSRGFSGGNKDGYSIKVATTELMKRSEANKIMIIMSDGLPSDYPSHNKAINDVKIAVKEARKNGIKVIAMFFGDDNFRRNTYDEYKFMYEKNLINCAPENITRELVKEIRNLFMSR